MLTNKQIRMLQLLDKQVIGCRLCPLHENGGAKPLWSKYSKYAIIGESPNYREVQNKQISFSGPAGEILTDKLERYGFKAKEFLIINTVQCRPNKKPTDGQIEICQPYLRKYLRVVNPEKILCLGNYAKYIFDGRIGGVLRQRGTFNEFEIGSHKFNVLFTINPAFCIYNRDEGMEFLQEDLRIFKETEFQRQEDWLFSEEDFKIY